MSSDEFLGFDEILPTKIKPADLKIGKNYIILNSWNEPRNFGDNFVSRGRPSQKDISGDGVGYKFKGLVDAGRYAESATFKRIGELNGVSSISGKTSIETAGHRFYDINDKYFDKKKKGYKSSSSTDPLPDPLPDDGRAKKSRRSKSSSSSGTRRTIKNPTVMDIPRFRDGEAITFTRELLDRAQFFDMIRRDRTGQYEEDRGYPPERGIKFIFHKP